MRGYRLYAILNLNRLISCINLDSDLNPRKKCLIAGIIYSFLAAESDGPSAPIAGPVHSLSIALLKTLPKLQAV